MKHIFLLLATLFCTQLLAQNEPGFIVTMSNDTVRGKFKLSTMGINALRITFKADTSSEVIQYQPFQIKGWKTDQGAFYESKAINYKSEGQHYGTFMRRLTPANVEVRCYEYYNDSGQMGFVQTFLEKQGKMTELQSGKFYKQLAAYLIDHKKLSEEITQKKFKKTELAQILDAYNTWYEKTNWGN